MLKVVGVLPRLSGGGAERVMLNLLGGLDSGQFTPSLVVFDAAGPLLPHVPAALPVRNLERDRLRHSLASLLRVLREIQPDIVFSTLGYVSLALAACRMFFPGKLVIREANMPSLSIPHAPYPMLTRYAYGWLYPKADLVIASSDRMAGEISALGVAAHRLATLANPVDIPSLRARAQSPLRRPGPGLRLIAAGRLTYQKGFDRLIPLLAGIPDLDLTVLGEGPQRGNLEALAARHGVRVYFPGFVDESAAWFAGADAFVLPSRWEGMPNVALEALACGTKVISVPEAGGIAEVAAAAVEGAVTIAEAGPAFVSAVKTLRPHSGSHLRPSLLPDEHDLAHVRRTFGDLLVSLTRSK
ncbi:glycosyltransferase [Ferrovibrio sp.]|uniref:glycosyltransferase n=1 Tax=Ferrovibrio sp. TaxID=1917215 RepID=UPI0035188BD6